MSYELIIIDGPERGRRITVNDGQELLIGRGNASDTRVNDPHMSRVHCKLSCNKGTADLVDLQSAAGTFVGGERIRHRSLNPGDVFQAGETRIRFQLENALEATTLVGAPRAVQPRPMRSAATLKNLVGKSLGSFRLGEILAEGQTGVVFKAVNTEDNCIAAVKVLTPPPDHSEAQKDRFVRAMKTMLPVRHPNIVQLYAAGKSGPYCWAAMEYVDGESMTEVIDRIGVSGMLDWREAYRVAVHIGRALAEAYDRKIIHRNVTPSNILRRNEDKTCLLGDLMLAKALEGSLARQVTRPGELIGDAAYMSPERTMSESNVDHRSDLYGLGATLYALLSGRAPFESSSLPELVRMVRHSDPKPPKEYQLSIDGLFEDTVLKLLAKRPQDRFQTPGELLERLEQIGRYNNVVC